MSQTDPTGEPAMPIPAIPAAAIPAMPVPAIPVEASTLPYAFATDRRRPGIITAIGVLCITVAILSGFTSLISGGYTLLFYTISKAQAQMSGAATATTFAAPNVPATPAQPMRAPTLPAEDAGVALNTLDSMLSLDDVHLRELDRLVRRHGGQIFDDSGDSSLTAAAVQAAVTQSTPLPDKSGKAQFSTAQGTVEIYPDRAVFTSADGATVVETSARHNRDSQTTASTNATVHESVVGSPAQFAQVPATLTAAQVKTTVSAVQQFGISINPAQLQALRAELAKPKEMLTSGTSHSPVVNAFVQPNGNLALTFDTGNMLILDPQGKVILSGPMPIPNFGVSGALATVNGLEAIASLGLAIYLLIVGIIVLRGSFSSPRLLRIFAWIKIPLAIVAGIGLTMVGYAIANVAANNPLMGGSMSNAKTGFVFWGVMAVLFGMALPVGILIALRTKTVREFYNSVAPSQ